tara:strand:- start:1188 stop:2624 length:1437 start_codon:yes stop_codon:yes gene_type:complete
MPKFNIITSIDKNSLIGLNDKLAYSCVEDLYRFQSLTNGSGIILMGRKTWDSLPLRIRPLKNRQNYILSKSKNSDVKYTDNVFFINNVEELIKKVDENQVIYCIGGAGCIKLLLTRYRSLVYNIILTHFDLDIIPDKLDNPVYFPSELLYGFDVTISEKFTDLVVKDWKNNNHNPTVYFKTYQRNNDYQPSWYYSESLYLEQMRQLLRMTTRKSRNAFTFSTFGLRLEYDCRNGKVPLLTSKKMAWKTVIRELLWFINGSTNNKQLQEQKVHIWDGNSSREYLDSHNLSHYSEGDCGPIYGHQWRFFGSQYITCESDYTNQGVDQLIECEKQIINDSFSRRIILCAWNPSDLNKMVLPPCHVLSQFYVNNENELSLQLYQRSGDMFLGVPFNMFSYSVLLHLMAQRTGKKTGSIIHILGDAHVYKEHEQAIYKQLENPIYNPPTIHIKFKPNWEDYDITDFSLNDYISADKISAPMIS